MAHPKQLAVKLFQTHLVRPSWVPFYTHLYKLSLRGMGILNSEGSRVTGEAWLFHFIKPLIKIKTLCDVGANTGGYTGEFLSYFPKAQCYCFEPNPETFQKLKHNLRKISAKTYPFAVSDHSGNIKLYDLHDDAPLKATQPTATLASLYPQVIKVLHHQPTKSYLVKAVDLDGWVRKEKIPPIDWLKIDTEGHELSVIRGARQLIASGRLGLIQFEFNDMHAFSHTFLKDIIDLLPHYRLFRLLPHGWWPLDHYRPLTYEVFGFQNLVAISPSLFKKLKC